MFSAKTGPYFTRRSGLFMFAQPFFLQAQARSLFGSWSGERPTDGYVWQFRYDMEFIQNSPEGLNFGVPHRYRYTVRQISGKKRLWTLTEQGAFVLRPTDSKYWKINLELHPDDGSQSPPTEEDRMALVDVLGLPDNNARRFRIRNLNDTLTLQLSDGLPSDGLDRVWYLNPRN